MSPDPLGGADYSVLSKSFCRSVGHLPTKSTVCPPGGPACTSTTKTHSRELHPSTRTLTPILTDCHHSPCHGFFTIRGTVQQLKESQESFGFLISSQSGLRRSLCFLLLFGDGNRIQKTSPSVGSGGGNPAVNDRIQDTANTKAQLSLLF
ncbi:unnamed protein product [Ranitomeya imitator]|uniref:Uncharacterized protein n=1 Tax=Ranitomeya imitator TaxID=111125 RepID=A0ABN9KZL4_9NEOB|nr:unnamed protein product [Ranitomeya imitator]